jgi:hypothetical protein
MCTFSMATLGRTTLVAVPAFAALAAIAAPARLEAQATVYYACYVPSSGTVYRIKEPDLPQQCGSSNKKGVTVQHVEFSWTDGQGGPSTPADHGVLTGLIDDDHPQYLLADGVRNSSNGFAVTGTLYQGGIAATGPGTRMLWYPGKAAFRAGNVNGTQWDDANIGVGSFATGGNAIASGSYSAAIGGNAVASGSSGIAMGAVAKATGNDAVAVGRQAEASGNFSLAMGEFAKATSTWSTAIGNRSTAASAATAIGRYVTASGLYSMALGSDANTNGKIGAVVMSTAAYGVEVKAAADYQFVARANRFWFGNNANVTAPAGQLIATSTGAYLTVGGAWVNSSDVNRKANFGSVVGEEVLGKVAALPIQTWNYRDEDVSTRHMGPTAQDFRAAFGLGANETSIATVDADGVSLAAIQALEKRTRLENEALRAQLQALTERVEALKRSHQSDHR